MSLIKKKEYKKGHFKPLKDAAETIGCSPDAIRKGIIPIPVVRLTKSERPLLAVRPSDLNKYIEECEREAGIED